jgi:2-hydroxycyclohexanecarboxyl-CoA dehydrogenase
MAMTGRVAIVTGAAQGIGAAIAGALSSRGVDVGVFDLDPARAGDAASRLASAHGARAVGVAVDVSVRAEVEKGMAEVESSLGPVDILVNNAGIEKIEPFLDSSEETWDRILAVNLKGVFNCCHVIVPGMIERGRGNVVNIGSDAGKVGSSGEAVYSATKGGVIAFTKTLAREVARHGINVNCVCPGPTDTALLDQVAEASQKLYDSLAKAIPLRRLGQPADVAGAVAFLASDEASFITGQALSVSGGLTMG